MRGLAAGAVATCGALVAGVALAQSPMTPVRPLSSPPAAAQWVEPPPAAAAAPAASAPLPNPGPAAVAADPEAAAKPPPAAGDARLARRAAHAVGGSTASRLNRQELARIRSGGGTYYYPYRSYSFWPFRF